MTASDGRRGSPVDEMLDELTQLRRGHGLHAADVLSRVGPRLSAACGFDQSVPGGDRRRLLTERINVVVATLPPEARLAVQAAFALAPASQARFLKERMSWFGDRIGRDPRTAARRVDVALTLLAEALVRGVPGGSRTDSLTTAEGWYLEFLRVNLLLDAERFQLFETHRIIATKDGLDRVKVCWAVPGPADGERITPAGIDVEMLFGGALVRDDEKSATASWIGWLLLPRPLAAGDGHEYEVRVTSGPSSLTRFVHTPNCRHDEFELRVKFDPAGPPGVVRLLDGVPVEFVEDGSLGYPLQPDAVAEVSGSFRDLQRGRAYGVAWERLPTP